MSLIAVRNKYSYPARIDRLAAAEGQRQALMVKHAVFHAGAAALLAAREEETYPAQFKPMPSIGDDTYKKVQIAEISPVVITPPAGITERYVLGSKATSFTKRGDTDESEVTTNFYITPAGAPETRPVRLNGFTEWLFQVDYGDMPRQEYERNLSSFGDKLSLLAEAHGFQLPEFVTAEDIPRPHQA